MTTIELQRPLPHVEFEVDQRSVALGIARERLAHYLQVPYMTEAGFCNNVVEYVNAFQDFHFSTGNSDFADYDHAARTLKIEAAMVTGTSVEALEDVLPRMLAYCNDETAALSRKHRRPVLPRAMMLTLIDLIDEHRPNTPLQK